VPLHPRLLRRFVALDEHRDVRRAAHALEVSEAAVLRAARLLEQQIGTPLVASRSGGSR
jgi:DNA-binding transcriptional LysR family regulator